ncbi:hypothetical protein PQ478_08410 [Alkalihalophilus pseudofirmus]|uniref:hypothetical protein n=1 Tax=Alkalihalophilus pseudofirmus TaxID=79885 RepID=UPI00259AF520|nr:hypothetical protein [Alkalihalophilus pseudofirmus]WEG18490.1 hypothetical protein PQ478_08410 [Alkalihalophilus pseudofirmus]
MLKRVVLFGVIFSILLLSACNSSSQASDNLYGESPEMIDHELWNSSHLIINILKESVAKKENTTKDEDQVIISFVEKYYENLEEFNIGEQTLIMNTFSMIVTFRANIYELESNGNDYLIDTLVEIESLENLISSFKDS